MTSTPAHPFGGAEPVAILSSEWTAAQSPISRRSVLAGLGLSSLGLLSGPGFHGPRSSGASAAAPTAAAGRRRTPTRVRDGNGTLVQPGPYFMQASCELSEDYFRTSDVLINSDDRIFPFVNPKNNDAVEAIVFANGIPSHLYRDPSASSGWSYQAIDLQGTLTDIVEVAVAANATDVYLLMFGTPAFQNNPAGDPAWLTTLEGPNTWGLGTTSSYADLGWNPTGTPSIKGGVDPHNVCYFYTSLVEDDGTTLLLGWVATKEDYYPLAYQQYLTLNPPANIGVEDYIILFDNSSATPVGYALVLTSDGNLTVYPEVAFTNQTTDSFAKSPLTDAGAQNVTALLWAWATPGATGGIPGYAVQQTTGTALVDENGNYNQLWDTTGVSQAQATVWLQNGLYAVNLLDSNGAVHTVQETSNDGAGTWAPALPLTTLPGGFATIYSVPTDPTEATLFAVGVDTTLSVLSLDASGWTQTQVRQDGAQLAQIDSYRVHARVLDVNGAPVGLGTVQVGTDRPVGFWQASGSTTVTPAAPVTMTADGGGQLVFSVPAEEIDTAILTMQALDASGNPSGNLFTVTPDTDLREFLLGTGKLLSAEYLDASSLLAATQSGGGPLFTTLTTLPDDQQQSTATAVAGAFNQLITVGLKTSPLGPTATRAMLIDVSTLKPTVSSSTNPNAYNLSSGGLGLQFSLSHLFDTIGHALRHAAVTLQKAVVRWVGDTESWVVDLAIKIGDDVVTFTDLVHPWHQRRLPRHRRLLPDPRIGYQGHHRLAQAQHPRADRRRQRQRRDHPRLVHPVPHDPHDHDQHHRDRCRHLLHQPRGHRQSADQRSRRRRGGRRVRQHRAAAAAHDRHRQQLQPGIHDRLGRHQIHEQRPRNLAPGQAAVPPAPNPCRRRTRLQRLRRRIDPGRHRPGRRHR